MAGVRSGRAFLKVKPLCNDLMKEANHQNAKNILSLVDDLPDTIVQDLLEYISIPVTIHLKENISKDIKLDLVKIIRSIISKGKITNLDYFKKLYFDLLIAIYDKENSNSVISSHEELKEIVVECLKYLILNSYSDVIEAFYIRENAEKISNSFYLCLMIAKTEKCIPLRISAIETLITLSNVHDEADPSDIVLRNQIADIVMLIFPGIVKGLLDVALQTDVQNHKITMMAVRALGRIISLVMEDLPQEDEILSVSSLLEASKASPSSTETFKTESSDSIKKQIRNREWLDSTANHLQLSMEKLSSLSLNPHFKVRLELIETVKLILTKCPRNMNSRFPELVEVLITLSEDDFEQVQQSANEALLEVNSIITKHKMRSILEVLEDRFYKLLTTLPRIIRKSDDTAQFLYLNQLSGYLKLLGKERLPHILNSTAHLRRLILSLVHVVELDYSDITTLEEKHLGITENLSMVSNNSWKKFKFIQGSKAEGKLMSICKLLSELSDLPVVIDYFLELLTNTTQYRLELILLINWILSKPINTTLSLSLYEQVIDFYVKPEIWNLQMQVKDDIPLGMIKRNVLQCCLLTEGLGLFISLLNKDYEKLMLKTLYLIIERAGSGHGLISFVGSQALELIAKSQGHLGTANLIQSNFDYFSYHVIIKLRKIEQNPGVLDVISIVMKYCSLDLLSYLKEIVEDTLNQLKSNFQTENTYSFLKVLHTFILCIKQSTGKDDVKGEAELPKSQTELVESVIKDVVEYCEAKRVSEKIENVEIEETPEDILKEMMNKNYDEHPDYNQDEAEEEEEKPPIYINLVEDVMRQCLNFMPSKDVSVCLLAMLTLQEGLFVLKPWENQLLPIVHEVWHPLVDRFNQQNVLIINRAWQLLFVLAQLSQSFIRSRTLKQITPPLAKFLSDSAKQSYKKDSKNPYKFTQMFKLQKLLLSQMGQVAQFINLQELETWGLLTTVQCYLSCYQHYELQDCCINLFKYLAHYKGDIVWVKLLDLWNSKVSIIPIDSSFSMDVIKLDGNMKNEFQSNVYQLLIYVNEINKDTCR